MEKSYTIKTWQVTPKEWATGFDIYSSLNEHWEVHMSGVRKEPLALFTDKDREEMNELRDWFVMKLTST
jgi:hypothetical protein